MKKQMVTGLTGVLVLSLVACGKAAERRDAFGGTPGTTTSYGTPASPAAGAAPVTVIPIGPPDEPYEATERCALNGTKLMYDNVEVYDSADLNSDDFGGTTLSKYNLLKHAGACKQGAYPRCKLKDGIYLDGIPSYSNSREGKKIAHYINLAKAGGCDFASGDRCQLYSGTVYLQPNALASVPDADDHLRMFIELVKVGGCLAANSSRCTAKDKSLFVDGTAVFTTAIELERVTKYIEMVKAGQCK